MSDMRGVVGRLNIVRAGVAALVLGAGSASPARAEDGGFFGFLSAALGGGGGPASSASPPPAPSEGEQVRPLTVRRAPKKAAHAGAGRAHLARVPTKTGPVSIYEDPTLRTGDAVMTKDGMKVFAGGRLAPDHPYADADFIAVSAAKSVSPNLKKAVTELNKLPHG